MAPENALTVLDDAIADGDPALVVVDVDWERFLPTFTLLRPSPLLGALPEVAALAARESRLDAADASPAGDLLGLPPAERAGRLLDLVRAGVAAVLGHASGDQVEPHRAFRDIGFDSLTAVELRNRLRKATGLPLAATVVFDHPSPQALADHLHAALGGEPDPAEEMAAVLERLEKALLAAGDAFDRDRLVGRVQTMLTRITAAADGPDETVAAIDDASDDDLFAFINEELGKSN
uniref:Carrier domain-containing protein n=1 Tax=Micromonospora carbonacea TaxID=47853 RepID=A0A7D6CHK4_9ACTN|nr:hypothetical protein HZU44_17160 [Micromonospora carbonacea]